jgi:hypothetical protein
MLPRSHPGQEPCRWWAQWADRARPARESDRRGRRGRVTVVPSPAKHQPLGIPRAGSARMQCGHAGQLTFERASPGPPSSGNLGPSHAPRARRYSGNLGSLRQGQAPRLSSGVAPGRAQGAFKLPDSAERAQQLCPDKSPAASLNPAVPSPFTRLRKTASATELQ